MVVVGFLFEKNQTLEHSDNIGKKLIFTALHGNMLFSSEVNFIFLKKKCIIIFELAV